MEPPIDNAPSDMKEYEEWAECNALFNDNGYGSYSSKEYACYNEDIGERKLCPFAATDRCPHYDRLIQEQNEDMDFEMNL